jgi:cation:H+ antiporter
MIFWVVREGLHQKRDVLEAEFAEQMGEAKMTMPRSLFWLTAGLLILLGGARLLVWGAVETAEFFEVSDLIVGLTVVALGTSLPELATSVVAAHKKEYDIAVGHIVGSNMFNLLGVLALPGLIAPGALDPGVVERDYPVMVGITLLWYVMARVYRERSKLTRPEGVILLLCFFGYLTKLYLDASGGG